MLGDEIATLIGRMSRCGKGAPIRSRLCPPLTGLSKNPPQNLYGGPPASLGHFRLFISTGYKSSVVTPRTEARRKSSLSLTHRNRASICDKVPLLMSKPANWQRAANSSCVRPDLLRNFLICGPTTLAGVLVRAMPDSGLDSILEKFLSCYAFLASIRNLGWDELLGTDYFLENKKINKNSYETT